jgi:hypothetical protein
MGSPSFGVSFGPNPGAIVHFSTSSLTRPPGQLENESLREPLRSDYYLGPSGLGSPMELRNCAITLESLVATQQVEERYTLEVHPQMMMPTPSRHVHGLGTSAP